MHTYVILKHTTWEYKYQVVFISKCRHKALYVQLRRDLGPVFRDMAEQKECQVEEGHLMPDTALPATTPTGPGRRCCVAPGTP